MTIRAEDITFIIQGPVNFYTETTINSIKTFFAKSKIIVSTWEGSNIQCKVDKIILNKDPGSFPTVMAKGDLKTKENNINRQIISTINALKEVSTKYAFKIRTDFKITGNTFLNFFDQFDSYNEKYKIFKHKVIACNIYTCNPQKNIDTAYVFHVSDFAFFGLTEDLIDLYDIKLVKKNENLLSDNLSNFFPEQIITISWLQKHNINFELKHFYDKSKENIALTEQIIANNFILLDFNRFNILPLKKDLQPPKKITDYIKCYQRCYSFFEYMVLYKKLCDNNFKIHITMEESKILFFRLLIKIQRLFFKPVANIICWFIPNKKQKRKVREFFY